MIPKSWRWSLAGIAALWLCCSAVRAAEPPLVAPLAQTPLDDADVRRVGEEHLFPRVHELPAGATVQLRGRIETDFLWSTQTAENEDIFGDLGDVVGLRRARIGAQGDLPWIGGYVAEIDLATGEIVLRDVYASLGAYDEGGQYRGGHFREPFSFEGNTSSRYLPFMERSTANMFDPARSWGLGDFIYFDERDIALAFGAFQHGSDPNQFEVGPGSTFGFTGRVNKMFVDDGDGQRLLMVGLALSERIPEAGTIRINQQPRTPLLEVGDSTTSPFVPVISIPANFQQLINPQATVSYGPWWASAEWYGSLVNQTGGGGDVFFHGSYLAGGWFVTGEHRGYQSATAEPGPIRVARPLIRGIGARGRPWGMGAFEIVGRVAYVDTFDSDTPVDPDGNLQGVQMPQLTVGTNWYLSDRLRLMFNYNFVAPDEINVGTSTASVYGMRLATYW